LLLKVWKASKKNSFHIKALILLANVIKSDATYFDIKKNMRVGRRFPKAVFYPADLITVLPTPNQSYFLLRQTAH